MKLLELGDEIPWICSDCGKAGCECPPVEPLDESDGYAEFVYGVVPVWID